MSPMSVRLTEEIEPAVLAAAVRGDHEVNETHFEEVRVPVENRVGPEHQGWTCAKYLLTHERTNIANTGVIKRGLKRLRHSASSVKVGDGVLAEQPSFTLPSGPGLQSRFAPLGNSTLASI